GQEVRQDGVVPRGAGHARAECAHPEYLRVDRVGSVEDRADVGPEHRERMVQATLAGVAGDRRIAEATREFGGAQRYHTFPRQRVLDAVDVGDELIGRRYPRGPAVGRVLIEDLVVASGAIPPRHEEPAGEVVASAHARGARVVDVDRPTAKGPAHAAVVAEG